MKVCLKCKQEKNLHEFNKKTRNKDGLETHCKECTRAEKRALRARNPEKIRELEKRWHANNKDKAKAIRQRTYAKNKEKFAERGKKYRTENAEKVSAMLKNWRENNADYCKEKAKKYRTENKEKVKAGIKDWLRRNPDFVVARIAKDTQARREIPTRKASHQVRTLTLLSLQGKNRYGEKATKILGITPIELRSIFVLKDGLQIDHICPFAQARNVDEVIRLGHYSNIRLVTPEENQAKKHKKTAEGEALCRALLGREWIGG